MSGKYRLDIIDETAVSVLEAQGYKLDGRSLLVDIEEIGDILALLDEEELEFDDNDD